MESVGTCCYLQVLYKGTSCFVVMVVCSSSLFAGCNGIGSEIAHKQPASLALPGSVSGAPCMWLVLNVLNAGPLNMMQFSLGNGGHVGTVRLGPNFHSGTASAGCGGALSQACACTSAVALHSIAVMICCCSYGVRLTHAGMHSLQFGMIDVMQHTLQSGSDDLVTHTAGAAQHVLSSSVEGYKCRCYAQAMSRLSPSRT